MKIRSLGVASFIALATLSVTATSLNAAGPSETQISKAVNLTRGPFIATNGSTSVTTWVESISDEASRIMVSTKVGSGSWSKGTQIGALEWSAWTNAQAAVTASGRVFVAWTDDEDIRFRERAVDGTWSDEVALPESTFDGQWQDEIAVKANGETITVIGVHSLIATLSLKSWTRAALGSDWVSETIANIPQATELGTCNLGTVEACRFSIFDLKIATNASGAQAIAFMTYRDSSTWELPGSRFAMLASVRDSASSDWSTPQVIDTLRPGAKDTQGYAYFLDDIVITPNGKVGVSWYRGLDSTGYEARVAVKSGTGDTFVLQDTATFQSGYSTGDPLLGTLGNTIYVAYKYSAKASSDPLQKFGTVGNLAKTSKTFNLDVSWDVQGLFNKDGDLAVLLAPDTDTKAVGAYTSNRNSDGTWTAPVRRSVTMPGFYMGRYNTFQIAVTATEQYLVFSKQTGTCPRCTQTGVFATNFK